jgi:hypothetical protein
MGKPGDMASALPPPNRPALNARDNAGLLNAFAHPGSGPGAQATAASRHTLVAHAIFADLDDNLPLVEITGEFSFLEDDSRLTDRQFAALVTNTQPRLDVIPQQGSAVASVATLMPTDRQETSEVSATNEFVPLLIAPLSLPTSVIPTRSPGVPTSTDRSPAGTSATRSAGEHFADEDFLDSLSVPFSFETE